MMHDKPQSILQTQGVLGDMFTRLFREQFPAVMDKHGDEKVWMIVSTQLLDLVGESQRSGSYFRPARGGEPPVFTWKAAGVFHSIIRQFRLDFLRHLGAEEMRCRVFLGIYSGEQTPDLSDVLLAYPVAPGRVTHNSRPVDSETPQTGHGMQATPQTGLGQPRPRQTGESTARVIDRAKLDGNPERTALVHDPEKTMVSPDLTQSWVPINKIALDVGEAEQPLPPVKPLDNGPEPDGQAASGGRQDSGQDKRPNSDDGGGFKPREPVFFMDSDTAFRPSGTPYYNISAAPAEQGTAAPGNGIRKSGDVGHGPIVGKNPRNLPGNLYQEFFGFERMPFNNTPDTTFFFPAEKHQEGLSRLLYAISEKKGFVMISGEIGAGKSTLCRALLAQLPKTVKVALITHTHLDATQIIRAIAEDFGIETAGDDRYDVHQKLNDYLIDQLAEDATVVIIIDEAQNLSPETLEEVRMISNLETESEKLVQLILLGQPELRDKIKLPSMKQLRQRISVQFHLVALTRDETVEYIQHRLKVANPTEALNFKRGAMVEVFRYSGGTPRLINTICDNALVTAFTRGIHVVSPSLVREAAEDLDLEPKFGGVAQFFKSW